MDFILSNMMVEATAKFRGENSAIQIQKILGDALYADNLVAKESFGESSKKLIDYTMKQPVDSPAVTRTAMYYLREEAREKHPELDAASAWGNFRIFPRAMTSVLNAAGKEAAIELSRDFAKSLFDVRQLGSLENAQEFADTALRIIELLLSLRDDATRD